MRKNKVCYEGVGLECRTHIVLAMRQLDYIK